MKCDQLSFVNADCVLIPKFPATLARFVLGSEFQRVFAACKRQEHDRLLGLIPDVELDAYLDIV